MTHYASLRSKHPPGNAPGNPARNPMEELAERIERPAELSHASYRPGLPAEWESHQTCWLAWPSQNSRIQQQFIAFCEAIADPDPATGFLRGERLEIIVQDLSELLAARERLKHLSPRFHAIPLPHGRLRELGGTFGRNDRGQAVLFLEPEAPLASVQAIAEAADLNVLPISENLRSAYWESDGIGDCVRLSERPRPLDGSIAEQLGIRRDFLLCPPSRTNSITHLRLAGPRVALVSSYLCSDELRPLSDAFYTLIQMPAGPYLGFYVSNTSVIIPVSGDEPELDSQAVALIGKWFPGRKAIGLAAAELVEANGELRNLCLPVPQSRKPAVPSQLDPIRPSA